LVATVVNFGVYRLLKQVVLQIPNGLIIQNTKVSKLNFPFHIVYKDRLDFNNGTVLAYKLENHY